MNIFLHRPAALAAAIGILASLISIFIGSFGRIILLIAALVSSFMGVVLHKRLKYDQIAGMKLGNFMITVGVMTAMLMLSSILLWDGEIGELEKLCYEDRSVATEAVIIAKNSAADWYSNYDIELISANGRRKRTFGRLVCESDQALSIGDRISFNAVFSPLDEVYADYGLDKYDLIASGTRFVCSPSDRLTRLESSSGIRVLVSLAREKISAAISIFTDRDTAAIIKALLLSERDGIGIFRRDMKRCGTTHLLALSGMHLAVISAIIDRVGRQFKLSKPKRLICQIICAFAMLAIAGFPYSLMRAAVMLLIVTIFRGLWRDRDPITVLFWTAWLITLFDPAALLDVGFQLSFLATFGVAVSELANRRIKTRFHRFRKKHKLLRKLLEPLYGVVVSLSAQLFIIPILWLKFGEISLLSVPATLILSPFITVILWLALPYTAAACIGMSICAGLLGDAIGFASSIMVDITSALSSLPLYLSMSYSFSIVLLLLVPMVLIIINRFKRVDFLSVVILFALWNPIYFGVVKTYELIHSDENALRFATVKTDDAVFLRSGSGCMVIDVSSGNSRIIREIDSTLSDMNKTEIDTYMLTHLHNAHARGFKKLCESRLVRRLVIPEPETDDEAAYARRIIELSDELGIEVLSYSRTGFESIAFGNSLITVEAPGELSRSKHEVIGISFELGDRSVFYAGSSRWELEKEPLADTIVIGTHGPKVKSEPQYFAKEIFAIENGREIIGKAAKQ